MQKAFTLAALLPKVKFNVALRPQKLQGLGLLGTGRRGKRGTEVVEEGDYIYIYLSLHCHHTQGSRRDQEILEEGGGAGPSLLPRRDHE